jgi:hypothetical protein
MFPLALYDAEEARLIAESRAAVFDFFKSISVLTLLSCALCLFVCYGR